MEETADGAARLTLLAIDVETTGVDVYHGARPFHLSCCGPDGGLTVWDWPVDVWTRTPEIPEEDVAEVRRLLARADRYVGQNIRFDIRMLSLIGTVDLDDWPWDRTEDTLIAGHLLASNQPHDLTSMVTQRPALGTLGRRLELLEKALEEAVKAARRMCQGKAWKLDHGAFALAEQGGEGMPSAKEKTWRYDYWLPAAVNRFLREKGIEVEHSEWDDVTAAYADADPAATLLLWADQEAELRRRGLWAIYRERMRLPAVFGGMERRGVSSGLRAVERLEVGFERESLRAEEACVSIAAAKGYDLKLPKSGSNGSLDQFVFGKYREDNTGGKDKRQRTPSPDCLCLDPVGWTDGGNPSLDKTALDIYGATLDGEPLRFVQVLRSKRRRDTALTYLEGYRRFWLPLGDAKNAEWFVLHPSYNQTGTDTLRASSSSPNAQNISKQEERCQECHGEGCDECGGTGVSKLSLRFAFGPAPGREWWSLDAKNIELRLPAYLSGETELIDLFERPNEPPYFGSTHLLNFHTVYADVWEKELGSGVPVSKVGPHCKKKYASSNYQWCKNGGFCKQYGGQRDLTDRTFRRRGAYDAIEARFSRLADLNQRCISFAEKMGYVETLPDRTVDPEHGYPLLCTRTERGRVLPTVPLNYCIQGTAMWWTGRAMVRCEEKLREWRRRGFDAFLALQVHDELVFDLPKRAHPIRNPKASNLGRIRVLQRLMEQSGMDLVPAIPTPCNVEYHETNWGESVTV